MDFKEKVFEIVSKIPEGEVLTYKDIAQRLGNKKAYRVVANILSQNRNTQIPCHRVIKSDYTIGGYFGSYKNSWKKLALLLKEGVIAVMPTDTIYGICCNAFNKKSVEKVYKLRKRNPKKPCIILISKIDDLKIFGIKLTKRKKEILQKIWPAKISVILQINSKACIRFFEYLHRGTKSLAFRIPKSKFLLKILKISGPLIAPSANWENYEPAKTISEAKKFFGKNVVYYNGGKIKGEPSTLISFLNNKIEILRKGADFNKIKNLILTSNQQ